MRILGLICTLLLFIVCDSHAAPRFGTLTLKNGDRFSGQFLGYIKGEGLGWQHESGGDQLRVNAAEVIRLQLNAVNITNTVSGSARVRFNNGDELSLNLVGLNPQELSAETWFAGKLAVSREHLSWLVPGGEGVLIYNGPEGLRGWGAALMGVILGEDGVDVGGITVNEVMAGSPAFKSGMQIGDIVTHINGKAFKDRAIMIRHVKSHGVGDKLKVKVKRGDVIKELEVGLAALYWRYENGALVTDNVGSMIGRKLKWPKLADVSFDFAWSNLPALDVIICADKVREYNAMNGYKLRVYQNYAHLYRNTSPDGVSYNTTSLGTISLRWSGSRKANIRLLIDQNKATFSMLLDGKLVKTWKDREGFAGRGGALGFNPQLTGKMKISAIQLKKWSGQVPNGGNALPFVAGRSDQVQFTNGDNLSGSILSINDAKVMVKTPFAEVPVPMENVSTIIFVGPKEKEGKKVTGAQFTLGGIGRLTGALLGWNEGKVTIKSPLFGEIELSSAAITSVQFH